MILCPYCGSGWITFAKARNTYLCNYCKGLNATLEQCKRWMQPDLPMNDEELEATRHASSPQRIVVLRLLATLASYVRQHAELVERLGDDVAALGALRAQARKETT